MIPSNPKCKKCNGRTKAVFAVQGNFRVVEKIVLVEKRIKVLKSR